MWKNFAKLKPSFSKKAQIQNPTIKTKSKIPLSVAVLTGLSAYFYKPMQTQTGTPTGTLPSSHLNFSDGAQFKNKSLTDLIISYMVFKACQFDILVEHSPYLLSLASKIPLISNISNTLVKFTFFKQFCGGETEEELKPLIMNLKSDGINAILDLSVEADLDAGEHDYVLIEELFKKCLDAASGNSAALKVTALGSTKSLLNASGVLEYSKDLFGIVDEDADGLINFGQFCELLKTMPGKQDFDSEKYFKLADFNKDGLISFRDFSSTVAIDNEQVNQIYLGECKPITGSSVSEKYRPNLTVSDLEEFKNFRTRLDALCEYASTVKAKIMIDAEQSYFQFAIDHLVIRMMEKHNKTDAVIINTYQMYMKNAFRRLIDDCNYSRDKFHYAVKVVRGAYMNSERKRSTVLGVRDPINETKEKTDAEYNKAVEFLLHENITSIFATHNKDSVLLACKLMQELGIQRSQITFAQLYGMHDYLSYGLAKNGYYVAKYLPYGLIKDVLPYLIRRAHENKSVLGVDTPDMALLMEEIMIRLFGKGRGLPRPRVVGAN